MADFAGDSLIGHPGPMNRTSVAGSYLEKSPGAVSGSTADDPDRRPRP
jgi:hypothetical protein